MSYVKKTGDNLILNNGFHDANFVKKVNGKKRLPQKKFFIFKNEKIVRMDNPSKNHIHILETHDNSKRRKNSLLVIYLDLYNRLSFIIIKPNPNYSLVEIIDKAESKPAQRLVSFKFLNNQYILGVIRFRYANMEKVDVALGYDKSLNYKFSYLFNNKIRTKNAEKTNNLSLLTHLGVTKISKKDLLNKYIETSEINLPVYIKSKNKNGLEYFYPLKFDYRHKYNKKHYIYSSISHRLNKNIEYFLRKSVSGQLVFVITDHLMTSIKIKEKIGKLLSLFGKKEKYDVYFEKFAKNAGESAFELFKEAMSNNDNKSKYILDSKNSDFNNLQMKYGKNNILSHNSIKAFKVIFQARSFISSDLVTHLQRRLYDNSQLLKKKILSNNKKVFLQHGPSLATNVFERGYFNKKVPICPDYMVTNSELESSYFMKYPKFKRNQLIQLGIPNLDLYIQQQHSKKEDITFMLTWRPWDLTGKVEKDSYIDRYMQFIEIITNDSFYQNKNINIILHPKARLMLENQFPDVYDSFKKYIYEGDIKDALLKSKVLITDYSSICYYAFAGGSNIIYFWGDKELAENEYGAPNILQMDNRFGDVSFDIINSLNAIIKENYKINQRIEYKENYEKLIEHTDGNNTLNVYNAIKNLN